MKHWPISIIFCTWH